MSKEGEEQTLQLQMQEAASVQQQQQQQQQQEQEPQDGDRKRRVHQLPSIPPSSDRNGKPQMLQEEVDDSEHKKAKLENSDSAEKVNKNYNGDDEQLLQHDGEPIWNYNGDDEQSVNRCLGQGTGLSWGKSRILQDGKPLFSSHYLRIIEENGCNLRPSISIDPLKSEIQILPINTICKILEERTSDEEDDEVCFLRFKVEVINLGVGNVVGKTLIGWISEGSRLRNEAGEKIVELLKDAEIEAMETDY